MKAADLMHVPLETRSCCRSVSTDRRGFTLIEVLIAMVVLTLGAASLLSLFAAAASTHKRSVDRTHAALLAEKVLAEARVLYRPGVGPDEILAEVKKRLPEESDGYRFDLLLFHPAGDEWEESELFARVEVKWRQSGQSRAERFHTVLIPHHRLGEAPE